MRTIISYFFWMLCVVCILAAILVGGWGEEDVDDFVSEPLIEFSTNFKQNIAIVAAYGMAFLFGWLAVISGKR